MAPSPPNGTTEADKARIQPHLDRLMERVRQQRQQRQAAAQAPRPQVNPGPVNPLPFGPNGPGPYAAVGHPYLGLAQAPQPQANPGPIDPLMPADWAKLLINWGIPKHILSDQNAKFLSILAAMSFFYRWLVHFSN